MQKREFKLTATSPATATTTVTTATAEGLEKYDWFTIDAALQGGTGGVLNVYLQRYIATLDAWVDWVSFTQQAAGGAAVHYTMDSRMSATAVTTAGTGSTPALAVDTMACSHPGTKIRLVFVAGASTSAGAAQSVVVTGWKSE